MSNSWLNTLITWLLTTLKKVMFRKPKHDSHCIAISTETKNVSLFENSCFEITKQNCVSALMAKIFTATSDKYVITFLSLISLFWCLDRPRWLDIVLFQYSFGIVINSFRFFRKNNWTIIKLLYKSGVLITFIDFLKLLNYFIIKQLIHDVVTISSIHNCPYLKDLNHLYIDTGTREM